jgi:hypothetical protein
MDNTILIDPADDKEIDKVIQELKGSGFRVSTDEGQVEDYLHKLYFLLASPFSSNQITSSIAMSTAFSLFSWSASSSHCVMGLAFSPIAM